MMRLRLYLLILILALGTSLNLAQLQSRVDEVYFVRENTVFAWSPDVEIRQIGEPIPNLARIHLSPAGNHFLYTTMREEVTQLLDEECPCGGTTPTGYEFWLMDTITGEQTLIVGQPEVITDLREIPYFGNAIWSPDGQQIAWTEGLELSDLYIYDLATGKTTLVQEDIPSTALVSNIAPINRWTPAGIWFEYVVYDDAFAPIEAGYHVYDPAGGLITEIPEYAQIADLPDVKTQRPLSYDYWNDFNVDDNGIDTFITHSLTGWQTINVATGATAPIESGIIVLVAAAAPETSIRIYPSVLSDEGVTFREVYNNRDERITIMNGGFTLSRDGTFMIGRGIDNTLMVTDNTGKSTPLELPWDYDYSVGGRFRYQLERRTGQLWLSTHCTNSDLPFRFPYVVPDDDEHPMAHVLGTTANNLRDKPGTTGAIVGAIEGGTSLEILEGPVCSGGIAWWYVESLDMQRGWTAEGADNEYWIAPGCSVDYCEVEG